eukprot:scaffold119065_cov63-Phaeocystis_antarctica.AAC.2
MRRAKPRSRSSPAEMRMSSPSSESESSPSVRPLNMAESMTRTTEPSRLITGNGAGSRHSAAQAGASAKQSAAHESSMAATNYAPESARGAGARPVPVRRLGEV